MTQTADRRDASTAPDTPPSRHKTNRDAATAVTAIGSRSSCHADSYVDMLERLFADYEHRHPLTVIEHAAARARDDLAGQTCAGAHLELLERLIRQRLNETPPSRPGTAAARY